MTKSNDLLRRQPRLSPAKQALVEKWRRGGAVTRAIHRRSESGPAPLSFGQQQLWIIEQLAPGSPAYNISGGIRLTGALDVPALEWGLNEIVQRHEILRTTFPVIDGRPVQAVAPYTQVQLPLIDLCEAAKDERDAHARQVAERNAREPFDLACGPMLRLTLLQLDKTEYALLLVMHHIIADGWSIGIFFQELMALYKAFSAGLASPLADLPIQYADFAVWQRQWLQGNVLETQLAYWKRQLDGAPGVLTLPSFRPRAPDLNPPAGTVCFELDKSLTQSLQALGEQEKCTLFMTLLAAFNVLLYRYTGETDIVVGTAIANRERSETWGLIGFFANTLVLRMDLSGQPTFRKLLARVRETTVEAFAHQDVPFEKLVEELRPQRDPGLNPLFQIMLVLQNEPMHDFKLPGLSVTLFPVDRGVTISDCLFNLGETEQGLSGALYFNAALFETNMLKQLLEHFRNLLEAVILRADEPVEALVAHIPAQQLDLVIAATFTAELIEPSLAFWSQQFKIPGRIRFAPYSQVLQQLLDPTSLFARHMEGVHLILLRLEDWAQAPQGIQMDFFERLEQNTNEFLEALEAFSTHNTCCLICICPPSDRVREDQDKLNFLCNLERRIILRVKTLQNVLVLPWAEIIERYKVRQVNDPQMDEAGHVPYTLEFFAALGTRIARTLFAPSWTYKVIALDCDQTLWNGVCGEDGPDAVQIPLPYCKLQEVMVRQNRIGRLLCLCSQNDEADVVKAFRLNPQMPLKLQDLTSWRINWDTAPEKLASLANELQLPLNTFVYLSRNPAEHAAVRAFCPSVLALLLPQDPNDIPEFLDHVWILAGDQDSQAPWWEPAFQAESTFPSRLYEQGPLIRAEGQG